MALYAFSRDIRSDEEELITEDLPQHRSIGRRADETIGSGAECRLRETEDSMGAISIVDRRYFILLHRREYRDSEEPCIWCCELRCPDHLCPSTRMHSIVCDRESLQSLRVVRDSIRDIVPLSIDHPRHIDSCFGFDLSGEIFESLDTDLCEEIIEFYIYISGCEYTPVFRYEFSEFCRCLAIEGDIEFWHFLSVIF